MTKNKFTRFTMFMILSLGLTGFIYAQDTTSKDATKTTTTTTTTRTEVIQNADGTYTVIEYPVGKEVMVELTPNNLQGAKGLAKVMRTADGTTVAVDLSGLPADAKSYYVYAVDPAGTTTLLGPATISGGVGSATFKTPMNQFMLVLSPNEGLTTLSNDTPVVFRSSLPQGYAVVPRAVTSTGGAKQVAGSTTVNSTYDVPMLNIPGFTDKTAEIRINFSGDLAGLKGKAYIEPRDDGATQIKMRFDDMKMAPKNKRFILWAASSDGKYTKLGQVINTGDRQESEIRSETAMPDFGLFVTMEDADVEQPSGKVFSTFTRP